jgi:hypothetical protein
VGARLYQFKRDTNKRRLGRAVRTEFTTASVGSYGYGIVDENGREVVSLNIR